MDVASRWTPDSTVDALATSVSSVSLQTQGDILASNRAPTDPPETKILRDIPSTLQGLNSATLPFSSQASITLPTTLPLPSISVLHSVVEPALIYKSLLQFVDSPSGLTGQAFRRVVDAEMRGYLTLVTRIDEEIRKELQHEKTSPEWKQGWTSGGVTLKKCVYWLREPTMVLRLIADMVSKCADLNGGELINELYQYTSHGDPFISDFANRILQDVCRPFYEFVQQWIYTGDFRDPYAEFFIRKAGPQEENWGSKYSLESKHVPAFIDEDLVQKIFQTGKSLNFLRASCGDGEWVDQHGASLSRQFSYGEEAKDLEGAIDVAYKATLRHLMSLLTSKFQLHDHILALKNYILLGQGDFVAMLIELLAPSLGRPANTLYRHHLTSTLETAIRGSNAQYSRPEVLRNLDARMLEFVHGEIGWDVFTLEYRVEAPLDVIINPYATRQYLKIFNFLWRVKHVGFVLNVTWAKSITGARGVLGDVGDLVGQDWKLARACCGEMLHFICQLEYYVLYEVIESSWSELQTELKREDLTLDQLIEVHKKYLENITRKALLASSRQGKEDVYRGLLHEILKTMLAFSDAMETLYAFSVEEYTRRQTGEQDQADEALLSSIRTTMKTLKSEFQTLVGKLLANLAYQSDMEMRFLGVRLNYNEYYAVSRKNRTTEM
ncbi:gamma tubulin complex protein 3 [Myxozyma melibiosi]|uniref:Gamma tubulin complex protein 3 n=1 Tax=Myxozyma melibiosi TaxID=54550 RepID=A0ABR1EYC9_9ASCO